MHRKKRLEYRGNKFHSWNLQHIFTIKFIRYIYKVIFMHFHNFTVSYLNFTCHGLFWIINGLTMNLLKCIDKEINIYCIFLKVKFIKFRWNKFRIIYYFIWRIDLSNLRSFLLESHAWFKIPNFLGLISLFKSRCFILDYYTQHNYWKSHKFL